MFRLNNVVAALMAGGADFSLSAAQGRLMYTRVSARVRAKGKSAAGPAYGLRTVEAESSAKAEPYRNAEPGVTVSHVVTLPLC